MRQLAEFLVDTIPAQHEGLRQVLQDFPADVIVADDMYYGVLPMLLGPRAKRPPIVLCGTSILHCRRDDGAPNFEGLPLATTQAQRDEYAVLARKRNNEIEQPVLRRVNGHLAELGAPPLTLVLPESTVELADSYIQLSVPSFEFPRDFPRSGPIIRRERRRWPANSLRSIPGPRFSGSSARPCQPTND